jgi:hypothetical protein
MKWPRPRFTIRRLIVAVAIIGSLFAYGERWMRYKRLADYHRGKADESGLFSQYESYISREGKVLTIESNGHLAKSREYDHAAPRPWLRVSPEVIPVDQAAPASVSTNAAPGAPPFDPFK